MKKSMEGQTTGVSGINAHHLVEEDWLNQSIILDSVMHMHAHAHTHTHTLPVKVHSSYVQPGNTLIHRTSLCKQIQYLKIRERKTFTLLWIVFPRHVYLQLHCHHVEVDVQKHVHHKIV